MRKRIRGEEDEEREIVVRGGYKINSDLDF